jgi:D-glycero-alpha-D-manno-heptose-7-phosphate kinase
VIIARSPLRVSLGGGGTDLPSYFREHGGGVLAAAIDKYVYLTVHETFVPDLIVKYSRLERVASAREVRHPLVREALLMLEVAGGSLELTSLADIPAGTGLGSSGSFTTALLCALHAWRREPVSAEKLAEEACAIEIERLREPVGKQDQYIAAFGGVQWLEFRRDGGVGVEPVALAADTLAELDENLLLFFTGYSRSAGDMLRDQDDRCRHGERRMVENLHAIADIGRKSRAALERGDLEGFAALMDDHWRIKRERSAGLTNEAIDGWYALARRNGARGGKLLGAGGGGFLLFYADDKRRLRQALRDTPLREVRFRVDFGGARVVLQ